MLRLGLSDERRPSLGCGAGPLGFSAKSRERERQMCKADIILIKLYPNRGMMTGLYDIPLEFGKISR